MAKDPAFLFYPGDWNLGTMHLTLLEKGCYIELLILQFAKDKFTEAQAKHMLNGSFDVAWPNLREKFETDGTFYWNKRLKLEKERRQKFSESRRNNGSTQKTGKSLDKHMQGHMPKHMENENENTNSINKVEEKGEKSNYWFLKYYHSTYDFYKSKFNGQSASEEKFLEWKRFIDFIYKRHYEELFECKFLSPHDFAKLEGFTEDKWDAPLKKILATGIKPEHNLFFRIPEFLTYAKRTTNIQPNTTTKFNAGALQLLDDLKGKARTTRS
jgi:uncharacterized protein YdaU (DUF1376 family)